MNQVRFRKIWSTNESIFLSLPDQSQKSKTFVRDNTLKKEIGERTEKYSKFINERRLSATRTI